MPRKFKKPCSFPGCPNLTFGEFCDKHKKEQRQKYNKYERSPDSNSKYGRRWREIREEYRSEHPLCEMCLKAGRYVPMDEVHHIIPVRAGGTNDKNNLMSLCHSCHQKIHIALGDRHRPGE